MKTKVCPCVYFMIDADMFFDPDPAAVSQTMCDGDNEEAGRAERPDILASAHEFARR